MACSVTRNLTLKPIEGAVNARCVEDNSHLTIVSEESSLSGLYSTHVCMIGYDAK